MKTIEVKDLLSISGKGGLYRFIAQARNGIVVEAIEDKKRHVAPATARVSSMEDIAIFTEGEDVPLSDVFYKIYLKEEGGTAISHKSENKELKAYFLEILPEYDEERVYVSDIKKVISWYNSMHAFDLLKVIDKEEEGKEGEEGQESEKSQESEKAKEAAAAQSKPAEQDQKGKDSKEAAAKEEGSQ